MKSELGNLSNPRKFHNPISINNQDIGVLKNMLSAMLLNGFRVQKGQLLERWNGKLS